MARRAQAEPKEVSDADRAVGALMRIRRKEVGLSQRELARAMGISSTQLLNYEIGVSRITAGRLSLASRLLGAPIDYFFTDPAAGGVDWLPAPNPLEIEGAREMLSAYARITDPKLRQAVIALARNLAGG